MLRWFRQVTLTISAVICLLLVAITVRSYFVGDRVRKFLDPVFPNYRLYITLSSGWLGVCTTTTSADLMLITERDREFWHTSSEIGLFGMQNRTGKLIAYVGYIPVVFDRTSFDFCDFYFSYNKNLINGDIRTSPKVAAALGYTTVMVVNLYWLILLTGIPPLIALLLLWHKRNRAKAGLCRKCGYDLRASTDTCPECGTAIPESSVARIA